MKEEFLKIIHNPVKYSNNHCEYFGVFHSFRVGTHILNMWKYGMMLLHLFDNLLLNISSTYTTEKCTTSFFTQYIAITLTHHYILFCSRVFDNCSIPPWTCHSLGFWNFLRSNNFLIWISALQEDSFSLSLFFFFLAVLHGLQDLSSLIRDWTHALSTSAVKAQSPNYWTAMKFPSRTLFFFFNFTYLFLAVLGFRCCSGFP